MLKILNLSLYRSVYSAEDIKPFSVESVYGAEDELVVRDGSVLAPNSDETRIRSKLYYTLLGKTHIKKVFSL